MCCRRSLLPALLAAGCLGPLAGVAGETSASAGDASGDAAAMVGVAPGRAIAPGAAASGSIAGGDEEPLLLGSFRVLAEIAASWSYDSNVYFVPAPAAGDHVMNYSAALGLSSEWARHALKLHAAASSTRYSTYVEEDSDDVRVSADARYDIGAGSSVYAGVRLALEHEDRESPSARDGLNPVEYRENRYYAGVFTPLGRWSVRLGGTAQRLDFDDVGFIAGTAAGVINNDDRDRWQYTGGLRLSYALSAEVEPYLQAAVDDRRYVDAVDDFGFARDSDGRRYLLGMRWKSPGVLRLDAFVGRLHQDYADPRFADVGAPGAGLALQWFAAGRTTLMLRADRTVEETTLATLPPTGPAVVSPGYLNTYVAAGVEYRLAERLALRIGASVARADYEAIDRRDDYDGLALGAVYRVGRRLFVDLGTSLRKLRSSDPGESFNKRIVTLRIAVPLAN